MGTCCTSYCKTDLGDRKNYCKECQKRRAYYFKTKYYNERDWCTRKLVLAEYTRRMKVR